MGFLLDDDELEYKIKKMRRIFVRVEKQKDIKIKSIKNYIFSLSKPNNFKNFTYKAPKAFSEKIYLKRGSSANFQKSTAHSEKHNTRTEEKEPKYLLPQELRKENEFWNCGIDENELLKNELDFYAKNHKGGRMPQAQNCKWECVINLNETHTMADAQKVAEHIAQKFNFTATRIAIHRDEGHFETDEKGEKCVVYNYHAHLNFITLKNAKQNMRREHITAKKLSDLQTEIAEILKMERGEKIKDHERKHTKKHLTGRQYAQKAQALDNEHELTKTEIRAIVEQLRKNSKDKGYTKEYFKELSALKQELQEKSLKIDELNEILERFKREQDKLKAENLAQTQKIAELEKENAEIKAELAKNRTETALKAQNEQKPSQDINKELKTLENAPKEPSQNQKDLEKVKELDKISLLTKEQANDLKAILKRLNLDKDIKTIENQLSKNNDKIATPYEITQKIIIKLQAEVKKENENKTLEYLNAKQTKSQEPSQTITQKVNLNTKSEKSQDFFRNF